MCSPGDLEHAEKTESSEYWDAEGLVLVVAPDLLPYAAQNHLPNQSQGQIEKNITNTRDITDEH